ETQCFQFVVNGAGDRQDRVEIRSLARVQIEEKVIRVVDVVDAAGKRVMVDTAQIREIKQGWAIVSEKIADFLPLAFGSQTHGLHPFWHYFPGVLLEKGLAGDAVRVSTQYQRTVLQERQDVFRHSVVVGKQVALGVARLREVKLVEITEAKHTAVNFHIQGLPAPVEKLPFNGCFVAQHLACKSRR